MKKKTRVAFCILFVLCILGGCQKTGSKKVANANSENGKVDSVKYDDDTVLFMCQDRIDVENDRNEAYKYNWKGELLDIQGYIGYYAENGLAPAMDQKTGKIGYVDKSGVFVIPPIYNEGGPFSKFGLAAVTVQDECGLDCCGFINSKGEQVVECKYSDVSGFFDCGYALVKEKDYVDEYGVEKTLIGIIDKNCNIVAEPEDMEIFGLYNKYYVASKSSDYPKIYDYKGNIIYELNHSNIYNVMQKYNDEELTEDEFIKEHGDKELFDYMCEENGIYRITYKTDKGRGKNKRVTYYKKYNLYINKEEIFNGKRFVTDKKEYEISYNVVATTQSGIAYGVIKNSKTVIPFEYDLIYQTNGFFVAIKYQDKKGEKQKIDIYNSDFKKTAKKVKYHYYVNSDAVKMPKGFFEISVENKKNPEFPLRGVINDKGKVIVEPVFYRGITSCTYSATARLDIMLSRYSEHF